ncbi:hypothetical protein E4T42_04170 [Aureobasidium subglaciale]|nr:hypothetical protein E4T42_04170 [Aureobasidium subglaciale]
MTRQRYHNDPKYKARKLQSNTQEQHIQVAGSSHTTKTHTTVLAVSGWLTSCLGRRINLDRAFLWLVRIGRGRVGLRQGTVWGIRWSFSVILTVILTSTRSWFEAIRTGYEDVEGYRDLVKRGK